MAEREPTLRERVAEALFKSWGCREDDEESWDIAMRDAETALAAIPRNKVHDGGPTNG